MTRGRYLRTNLEPPCREHPNEIVADEPIKLLIILSALQSGQCLLQAFGW